MLTDKWAARTAKLRFALLVFWIAMAVGSATLLPDLQSVVRQTEQQYLPDDAESVQAARLLEQINPSVHYRTIAVIVVARQDKLRERDHAWMNALLSELEARKAELGIVGVLSAQSTPQLAERFLSGDGTTALAIVQLPKTDFDVDTGIAVAKLRHLLAGAPEGTVASLTGNAPISQDFQRSSVEGLQRTELLTIVLVFLILLVVFRSPVTPFIPLLTIGISYMLSRGMIGAAANWGLPVSNFTESFLIAVLFGAGTDYCILMIQRYREELAAGDDRVAALARTFRGVGKTIVFSASTVFVAFFLIGFAEFGLYRSAAGVAIGVLAALLVGMTLTPALLLLLGSAVFWRPSAAWRGGRRRAGLAHAGAGGRAALAAGTEAIAVGTGGSATRTADAGTDPRLPASATRSSALLAAKRPLLVLLAAAVLLTPIAMLFEGKRSFNDISEIDQRLDSVVGFRLIEETFGAGELFPLTIAVSTPDSFRTPGALAALEMTSHVLAGLDGVQEVRSAARPLGRKLQVGRNEPVSAEDIQRQEKLAEALKTLAIGAVPLSQGLIGALPSIRHLAVALAPFLAEQLQAAETLESLQQLFKRKTAADGDEQARLAQSLEQSLDFYVSPDGKITKFDIILSIDPYSPEAMDAAGEITGALRESLGASAIADPQAFASGTSVKYDELRAISYRDFVRTGLLVMAGIAVVLILLLRSLLAPLYVLLSLGFNYLVTMGITEFLYVKVFGYPGLSWTVSFFIFLVVVALGVDYSIFLMARFKEEYRPGEAAPAMTKALATTSGIIISAAAIMGSTFGALGFSGIATLTQIGVGTLIGLLLYATLFMNLIVPAFGFLFGEANWRPFRRR